MDWLMTWNINDPICKLFIDNDLVLQEIICDPNFNKRKDYEVVLSNVTKSLDQIHSVQDNQCKPLK